jgi:Leucine-rich repeat (LRR) protein
MPKLNLLLLSGCIYLPEVKLEGFDNLTELDLRHTKITKLELKKMPKLNYLSLFDCT